MSIQSQILNLLNSLQEKYNLTYLFISHNLGVVRYLCDRIAVMYLGVMVENATNHDIFENPMHPYTETLLGSVPIADPKEKSSLDTAQGEILFHCPDFDKLPVIENDKTIASQITNNFIRINNKEFLAVGTQMQNINWEIICYDEKLQMLLPQNMLYMSLQFGGVILLTIILSMFFSRRIKIPIVQLNEKMRKVENGSYELITTGLRHDQFGEMQQYFNSMIKRISKLIEVELDQKIKLLFGDNYGLTITKSILGGAKFELHLPASSK